MSGSGPAYVDRPARRPDDPECRGHFEFQLVVSRDLSLIARYQSRFFSQVDQPTAHVYDHRASSYIKTNTGVEPSILAEVFLLDHQRISLIDASRALSCSGPTPQSRDIDAGRNCSIDTFGSLPGSTDLDLLLENYSLTQISNEAGSILVKNFLRLGLAICLLRSEASCFCHETARQLSCLSVRRHSDR